MPLTNDGGRALRWPISEKIRYCQRRLTDLSPLPDELVKLPGALTYIGEAVERRNEVIHGRIYAEYDAPDRLRSGRRGVPDRQITAAELYDLANQHAY